MAGTQFELVIDSLHLNPAEWRTAVISAAGAVPQAVDEIAAPEKAAGTSPLEHALEEAMLTAKDGRQRGVESAPTALENLLSLRLAVRNALAATAVDSPLRHVAPWIWRRESLGKPLTRSGAEHGMELRVSRYATQQY